MANVSVLGAGSWGTALAVLLQKNGHQVTLWSHRESQVQEIMETGRNESKLPGVALPSEIHYTSDLAESCKNQDLIVSAVPSTATRQTMENIRSFIPKGQYIVSVTKGIEEDTLYTQCEIMQDVLPDAVVGILSGPSHAEEVVKLQPTAIVAGSASRSLAVFTQELFMNEMFRVYISSDLTGIEVGGSLKNVIALAAGMSDGLGFGDNAKAALITRGVKEITSLAVAMGGEPETLAGLTGIGDLIVTCQSLHSRNRKAGFLIGQGMEPKKAMDEVHMVVEGVYSAKAALKLGEKFQVELPIITEVNRVLFQGKSAYDAVCELMARDKKSETESITWNEF